METATDLNQQIMDLQAQIRELQHDLPDSSFQTELQRLQLDLVGLLRQKMAPVPDPRQIVVQPTPPPSNLTPGEAATFQTFQNFHQALLQYSGGGIYMPRGEWQRLANTAAEMTQGLAQMPTTGGPWGWNASTQQFQLVQPMMGRTDGSAPLPGQIGEVVQVNTGTPANPYVNIPVGSGFFDDMAGLQLLLQVPFTAGDWEVYAYAAFDGDHFTSTAQALGCWVSISDTFPVTNPSSQIRVGGKVDYIHPNWQPITYAQIDVFGGPQRITLSAPTTLYIVVKISSPVAADVGQLVVCWGFIHARRMS